ncbi:MAG: XRE family transcriptional regulator, partial [Chloroflexi bacterium]|nr:XRE family transcriptional regulator [Chloroflexota bacterium]
MVRTRVRTRRPAPVSELLEGLGERMRKARLAAGLSQTQVGTPHFTRAYVSAIELGKVRPSMKSLEFLAARLGKPTSFFVADEADERRRKEREARLARVAQLVAEGRSLEAIDDLESLRSD